MPGKRFRHHKEKRTPAPQPHPRSIKPGVSPAAPRSDSARFRPSPTAQAVGEKIARGGPKYLEKSFIRVMQDSYALAKEAEFADLYFDVEKTGEVIGEIIEEYKPRMQAAGKLSSKKHRELQDEILIETIERLVTPAFRKDVFQRLERCTKRLMTTDDAEKIEIALVVEPFLKSKEIPWGLCGLVDAIYHRSVQQMKQQFGEEEEIFGELRVAAKQGRDFEEVMADLEKPGKLAAMIEKLKARPGLRERLERELDKMVDQFEKAIWEGKAELDIFTEEELRRLFDLVREYVEANQIDPGAVKPEFLMEKYVEFTRQALTEILTPERMRTLEADLGALFKTWMRARNKWATPLHVQISWLDDLEVSENRFLFTAYLAQARRLGQESLSQPDPSENNAPSQSEDQRIHGSNIRATMPDNALRIYVCPQCKGALEQQESTLRCPACQRAYPIRDGLPDFMLESPETSRNVVLRNVRKIDWLARIYESKWWYPLVLNVYGGLGCMTFERLVEMVREAMRPVEGLALDVACGPGTYGRRVASPTRAVYGIDISPGMLRQGAVYVAREHIPNVHFSRASVEVLPFADGLFDGAICCGSLHLFPDTVVALREISRTMKPGAPLVGMTFTAGQAGILKYRRFRDRRRYQGLHVFEIPELAGYLAETGFESFQPTAHGSVLTFSVHKR